METRALFLTPEAPYPATGGGALRSASLVEYFGRRYALDVIVFREPGAPDPASYIPRHLVRDVLVLDLPWHSRRPAARLGRNLRRLVRGVPPLNDRFAGFGSAVADYLRGRRYRLSVIEHFWCAPYWERVAPSSETVVLDLHNVESVLMARYAAAESWPTAQIFRRFQRSALALERRWLPCFDLLLAASDRDAETLRGISPQSRVHVYPNALPLVAEPAVREEHVLAFSGNFDYRPNADAVRHFYRRMWPLLRREWPDLVWRLIGKHPETVKRYLGSDPGVQVLGPPDDAVAALAAAKVVVVPLRAASGTRVKILEAWAAGRPVVSTTVGAEGLPAKDGEHLLLANTPPQFVRAVSVLLESADMRRRLGSAGRLLYERGFTWEAAWSRLAETIL